MKLLYCPNIISFRTNKLLRIALDHSNKPIKLTHKIICINSYTVVRSILSQTYIALKNLWRWILISIQKPILSRYFYNFYYAFRSSSIYSCSIGHIWEHQFCHLGCWAVKGKFLKRRNFCFKYATFWGDFFNFLWAKNFFNIFLKIFQHPHWKVSKHIAVTYNTYKLKIGYHSQLSGQKWWV